MLAIQVLVQCVGAVAIAEWVAEGRPTSLYIYANRGESSLSTTSASALISLIRWLAGTRLRAMLVVDNIAAGPALGGSRMAPDVTLACLE